MCLLVGRRHAQPDDSRKLLHARDLSIVLRAVRFYGSSIIGRTPPVNAHVFSGRCGLGLTSHLLEQLVRKTKPAAVACRALRALPVLRTVKSLHSVVSLHVVIFVDTVF